MNTTKFISQSLSKPETILESGTDTINNILDKYPYFTPAWYIASAKAHAAGSTALNEHISLRLGNWIQYQDFLQKAMPDIHTFTSDEYDIAIPIPVPESSTEHLEIEENISTDIMEEDAVSEDEYIAIEIDRAEENTDQENTEETIVTTEPEERKENMDSIIPPVYAEDYFRHEGIEVSSEIPDLQTGSKQETTDEENEDDKAKSLMVMMSFTEWMNYFTTKKEEATQEEKDQKALKSMWQKQKLAAAIEEENEEIPEDVFEMAVNSIQKEEDLISESLAEILVKQGKHEKAIDMYRKLSLRNPQKNAYFARKIEALIKE